MIDRNDNKNIMSVVIEWNKYKCAHKGYNQSYRAICCLSDKGVVFGAPLTEEGIAQIYQLIEYLSKSEYHFKRCITSAMWRTLSSKAVLLA